MFYVLKILKMGKKLGYILNKKKAGIQIDFAFSIFIFLFFFIIFYSFYSNSYLSQKNSLVSSDLNAISGDICEILVSSSGMPYDWESDLDTIGFAALKSNVNNSLDSGKLMSFSDENYWNIVNSYNLEGYNLNIDVVGLNSGIEYLNFGADVEEYHVRFSNSVCFSNYGGEIVKVKVEVWT